MQIGILGPVEVTGDDGISFGIAAPKPRALLARLAIQTDTAVPTDQLIEDLWAGDPPPRAGGALHNYVSQLRKLLGPATIVTQPPGYLLRARGGTVDAERFERVMAEFRRAAQPEPASVSATLAEALGWWRGPALADVRDAPWAAGPAARLEELRLVAEEARIDADLALGRHGNVIAELETLVDQHPLRERFWAQLMLALYRSDRQAESLRAFRRVREQLGEELGIEPSADLVRLEEAIVLQRSELQWDSGSHPGERSVKRGAGRLPSMLTPPSDEIGFVGRTSELARLSAMWSQVALGAFGAVFIGGEPGIGKTRLAVELAARVRSENGTVLAGRCDEDVAMPYQPFVSALRAVLAACGDEVLDQHLASYGGELVRILPELARRRPDAPAPTQAEAESERYVLFEAVAGLLADFCCDQPALLVLDDLHWAAKGTLLMLEHVVRARPAQLLLVATYRPTELDRTHPLTAALADLRAEPDVVRMSLAGLDRSDVTDVVDRASMSSTSDRSEVARIVFAETDGNPLFVRELVRHLAEPGTGVISVSEGVREIVHRRIARLSPTTAQVIDAASVLSGNVPMRLLELITDADEVDSLPDAVDEAVRAGILVAAPSGAGFVFSHALIRRAIYEQLGTARRARLHRMVGEALEKLGADESQLGQLAHHFGAAVGGGDVAKAADYALRAGRRLTDQLEFDEAIATLERGVRALELDGFPDRDRRARLLLALGHVHSRVGDAPARRAAAERAGNDARSVGSAEGLAEAAVTYANYGVVGQADPVGEGLCEEALAALGSTAPALRARVMATLAYQRALGAGEGGAADRLAAAALDLARTTDDPDALALGLGARVLTLWGTGLVDLQLSLAEELLALGDRFNNAGRRADGLACTTLLRLELGDVPGFDRDAAELRRLGETLRHWFLVALGEELLGLRALLDGRLEEAEGHAAKVLDHGGGDANFLNAYIGQIFVLRREQGRTAEVMPILEAAVEQSGGWALFRAVLALAYLDLGRRDDAAAQLDALAIDQIDTLVPGLLSSTTAAMLAEAASALGNVNVVDAVDRLLQPHRGHLLVVPPGVVCLGAADRYLAMVAATRRDWDAAVEHFEAALALEGSIPSPPLLARTRQWYGQTLLLRNGPGDDERATVLLAAASANTEPLGAAGINRL